MRWHLCGTRGAGPALGRGGGSWPPGVRRHLCGTRGAGPARGRGGGVVVAPRGAVAPGWHPGSESGCKPEGKTCGGNKGGPPVEQKREAACGRHGSGWPREAQGPLSRSGWSPVDVVAARRALGSTVVEGPPGGGLLSSGCPVVCAFCWSSFFFSLSVPRVAKGDVDPWLWSCQVARQMG